MGKTIHYENPGIAKEVTSVTVTTTETDLMKVVAGAAGTSNLDFTRQSQLTFYYKITLGSATSVKLRYYYTPDGTTWFPLAIKNDSTGELTDTPSVIDSNTYTSSSISYAVEDIPMSGSMGYKVTATSVAANATVNAAWIYVRDN
jgi:hypothetical protein